MNKQTKFLIELLQRKNTYQRRLKDTASRRYLHKLQEVNEIIELYTKTKNND